MADDNADNNSERPQGSIFGADPAADDAVRQGGINQGQGTGENGELNDDDPADIEMRRRRQGQGDLVDDNAAAHMGGMGATGGVADFASQGNDAGMSGPIKSGSVPR